MYELAATRMACLLSGRGCEWHYSEISKSRVVIIQVGQRHGSDISAVFCVVVQTCWSLKLRPEATTVYHKQCDAAGPEGGWWDQGIGCTQ